MAEEPAAFDFKAREYLVEWIETLNREGGLDLVVPHDGITAFENGAGVICHIEAPEDAATITFHSPILQIGAERDPALLERLLTLNLFGLGTGGAALALDPATGWVVLCYTWPARGGKFIEFCALLRHFLDTAGRLKAELGGGMPAAVAEAVPAPADMLGAFLGGRV